MRVYHFLCAYIVLGTMVPIAVRAHLHGAQHAYHAALSFFLALNVLICAWEMALGRYISEIAVELQEHKKAYGNKRWDAAAACMSDVLTVPEAFSLRYWTRIWSTYALWDPSYANREAFGFFIDVGNGYSTLTPSLVFLAATTVAQNSLCSARIIGCIGLVSFWQMLYGTVIYALSFFFNKRHHGKSFAEVLLFVGFSNGLWFVFPLLGMWTSYAMIASDSYAVFFA